MRYQLIDELPEQNDSQRFQLKPEENISIQQSERDYPGTQIAKGLIESGHGFFGNLREGQPSSLPGQEQRYLREQQSPESLISESADISDLPEYSKQTGFIPKLLPTGEDIRKNITHRAEPTNVSEEFASALGTGGPIEGVKYALRSVGVPEGIIDSLDLASVALAPLLSFKTAAKKPPSVPFKQMTEETAKKTSTPSLKAIETSQTSKAKPITAERQITKEAPEIGRSLTKEKFGNTREGGQSVKSAIQRSDEMDYSDINQLYDKADKAESSEGFDRKTALSNLKQYRDKIDKIAHKDPAQTGIVKAIDDIVEDWKDKPITNQMLTEQIKSLNSVLKYNFEHGDAKNIYKPAIGILHEELERTSTPYAKNLRKEANQRFKDWVDLYDTDSYIRDLRNKGKTDFSGLYEQSQDIDKLHKLDRILSKSEYAPETIAKLKQDFIDERLAKHIKDGVIKDKKGFNKEISEIRSVLNAKEKAAFDKSLAEFQKESKTRKVISEKAEELKGNIEKASKAQEMKIEAILKDLQNKAETKAALKKGFRSMGELILDLTVPGSRWAVEQLEKAGISYKMLQNYVKDTYGASEKTRKVSQI